MAKIQLDDIKAEIEKDGWKLISTEYKNLDTIMEFVCSEGHQVFAPWKKIRMRRECPFCKDNPYKELKLEAIPKKKGSFRVLGLDQATKRSGFSIFEDKKLIKYGYFDAPENTDEIARDHRIKEWMMSIISTFEIDFVGIEGIQYEQNYGVTTFQTLARLQGILMETCFARNILFEVCPTNTWRAHCGVKGRSRSDRKASMKNLVKQWYDVSVNDDCADAIGIGKFVSDRNFPQKEIVQWE